MGSTELDVAALAGEIRILEDDYVFEITAMRDHAVGLERRAHELGEPLLAARARLCLGHLSLRSGDLPRASGIISVVNRWAVANQPAARDLLARSYSLRSSLDRHLGDTAAALEDMLAAVELLDESSSDILRIWSHAKLADVLGQNGSIVAARERYRQAERLAESLGQPRLRMGALNNWAWTECQVGDPAEAAEIVTRMFAVAAHDALELEPADLDTVASVHLANGEYEAAERLLRECVDRHEAGDHEDADALAEYLLSLAGAQRGLGRLAQAQASLDASRVLCSARELAGVLVRVHEEQAEIHAAGGRFEQALAEHRVFVAAHQQWQCRHRQARAAKRQAMFESAEARREAAFFREQALRDPLTSLRNRRFVDEALQGLLRAPGTGTVAMVDIDHFKRINDQFSHETGDRVLVAVAELLAAGVERVTGDGFAARLGGEEFLLVLPGIDPADAALRLDEIRHSVRDNTWEQLTGVLPVTVSIGVAGWADGDRTPRDMLSAADARLYQAKREGRDQVIWSRTAVGA